MTEQWKPIPGYEGRYEVSSFGRVRSLARTDRRGKAVEERILREAFDKHGYARVHLSRDNEKRGRLVHQLVLEAFVGPRPPRFDGCHTDGNPANNNLSNLRWDTHRANLLDAVAHGTAGRKPTEVCVNGHRKTGRNVRGLYCKTCQAAAGLRYRARNQSALDNHRTDRADQRAADRASAQGYGGGA